MRRALQGLRLRLGLALVATSVATLVAASLALVGPLERRVQDDRLRDLRELARTVRPDLDEVRGDDLVPGSFATRRLTLRVARRTGGRVALYDAAGLLLADTGRSFAAPAGGAGAADLALLEPRLRRHGDVREGLVDDEAVVLTGARTQDGRVELVLRRPLSESRAAVDVVRAALPVAALVGLGVGVLLALALSSGLLTRLRGLRDDVRALGDHGLGHPIAVRAGGTEVDEVARALEAMRVRLRTEEAARRDFLATASHELRTPLAALQGTLELLAEELPAGDGASGTAARAERALEQTHRLSSLAEDLLDLSRLDADEPLALEPVDLAEAAALVVDEQAPALAAAGRRLELAAGGPVHAMADPMATTRLLRILLDNARLHGAGTVRVAVAPGRVEVADEGPGVAPEEREAVFERFHRAPGGRRASGFGLGLAIARSLARGMGGDLVLEDGARFVVLLRPWP